MINRINNVNRLSAPAELHLQEMVLLEMKREAPRELTLSASAVSVSSWRHCFQDGTKRSRADQLISGHAGRLLMNANEKYCP